MRHPPSDRRPAAKHHDCMDHFRTTAVTATRTLWTRAALPSMVLAVAVTLDQYTRGPSISGMVLTWLLA
jgi:hypothetical protein